MKDNSSKAQAIRKGENAQALAQKVIAGDLRALARLLSCIEDRDSQADSALDNVYCMAGRAHVIGVTGAPGSGKSTLIGRLGAEIRRKGRSVGIIAIDPSSALTQGAILGDRLRMADLASDPGVFIRSMATRGAQGGLSAATQDAVDALDAAGFDTIIVETVGVGQDEIDIAYVADTTVVVSVPGLGDSVQSIKAGLLEMADIHVVNKADRPEADKTVMDLSNMLAIVSRQHKPWTVPVISTSAERQTGISELMLELERHRKFLKDNAIQVRRNATSLERRVWRAVEQKVVSKVRSEASPESIETLIQEVIDKKLSPSGAADRLLGQFTITPSGKG